MKSLIAAAALGLAALTAAPLAASAAQVDGRHYNQERRIEQGERSGRLTPREAANLNRQQNRVDRHERRMRSRNGGYLTYRQRARLRQQENRASRHIYRAKHNGRTY